LVGVEKTRKRNVAERPQKKKSVIEGHTAGRRDTWYAKHEKAEIAQRERKNSGGGGVGQVPGPGETFLPTIGTKNSTVDSPYRVENAIDTDYFAKILNPSLGEKGGSLTYSKKIQNSRGGGGPTRTRVKIKDRHRTADKRSTIREHPGADRWDLRKKR